MTSEVMEDRPPTYRELETVHPLKPDAEDFTSLSADTIKREYPQYVIQLSPRRLGIKFRHMLAITGT